MNSSTRGEIITAIISGLVAAGLLAAGVAAQNSRRSVGERIGQLEADLRTQLDFAYRHNATEKRNRVAELNEVLEKWRTADRTAANDELVAGWLEQAIVRSMAGSKAVFPEAPAFSTSMPSKPSGRQEAAVAANVGEGAQQQPSNNSTAAGDILLSEADQALIAQGDGPLQPIPLKDVAEGASVTPNESTARELPAPPAADARVDVVRTPIADRGSEQVLEPTAAQADPSAGRLPQSSGGELITLGHGPAAKDVSVNVAALTVRIASYHDAVEALEANLSTRSKKLEINDFRGLVEKAELLYAAFDFAHLYYEALPENIRSSLSRPRSLVPIIERLRVELRQAEQRTGDFLAAADAQGSDEFQQLDQLLAGLAAKIRD